MLTSTASVPLSIRSIFVKTPNVLSPEEKKSNNIHKLIFIQVSNLKQYCNNILSCQLISDQLHRY